MPQNEQPPQELTSKQRAQDAAKRAELKADSLQYRLELLRHRLQPGRWLHPSHRGSLAYERAGDEEENRKTTPGPNQSVDLRCLWAVEYYTPFHTEQLIGALRKLGLDTQSLGGMSLSLVDWYLKFRSHPGTNGWASLGRLTRGNQAPFGRIRPGPLPPFAQSVELGLFNVAPSVAAITASFALDEVQGGRFEKELRTDRATFFRPIHRGQSIVSPHSQKHKAIEQVRLRLGEETRRWFSEHLPGLFASGQKGVSPPVCEFLVLRGAEPFANASLDGMTGLLEINDSWHAFEADEWAGVRFFPTPMGDRDSKHAVLAAREETLEPLDKKGYGNDRGSHAAYFDRGMTELMVQWGAIAVLDCFEQRLSLVRDLSVTWTRRNAGRTLGELQALTRESLDLSTVCRDFIGLANEWPAQHPRFRAVTQVGRSKRERLSDSWGRRIAISARRLLEEDAGIKSLVVQHGNLLTARENLRLQHSVRVLAILTGVVTLLAAAQPLKHLSERLWAWWEHQPQVSTENSAGMPLPTVSEPIRARR